MTQYELLALVSGHYTDDEVGPILEQISALLEKEGAKISRKENLGRIKLAYAIKHVRHGSYLLVQFSSETSALKEMDRRLRLTDEVMRHMISKMPNGAETRTYELTSYVAPLSEEGRAASMAQRAKKTSKEDEGEVASTAPAEEKAVSEEVV